MSPAVVKRTRLAGGEVAFCGSQISVKSPINSGALVLMFSHTARDAGPVSHRVKSS